MTGQHTYQIRNFDLTPVLLDLTVTDHSDPANQVTAITDATVADLFIAADANDAAHVDLGTTFGPSTLGSSPTGGYVHISVAPSDPAYNDTYANLLTAGKLSNVLLQASPTVHDFAVVAWLDSNFDGIYETGEPRKEVDVHVVTVQSLTVTDYDDTTDTATTDDSTVPELVGETNASGKVHLSFSITTDEGSTTQAAKLVGWMFVDPNSVTIARGTGLWGDFSLHAEQRQQRRRRHAPRLGRRQPGRICPVVHAEWR